MRQGFQWHDEKQEASGHPEHQGGPPQSDNWRSITCGTAIAKRPLDCIICVSRPSSQEQVCSQRPKRKAQIQGTTFDISCTWMRRVVARSSATGLPSSRRKHRRAARQKREAKLEVGIKEMSEHFTHCLLWRWLMCEMTRRPSTSTPRCGRKGAHVET